MAGRSAIARVASAALVTAALAAGCHGGGDGDETTPTAPQQITASPTNIGFSAPNPGSLPPPARTAMVTVTPVSGQLFFRILPTPGNAAVSVDTIQMNGTNQVRFVVRPASPTTLGSGNHESVITVAVCKTDANCAGAQINGSPITIDVGYQVGFVPPPTPPAPPPESLAPSVGAASVPGNVVLRGSGFNSVTSVSFGATPAFDFTVMSDTEIRATYPALAAGTLPISLSASGTPVAFGQSLTLVAPGTLAAATLAYQIPPQNMRGLAFDAVTQTLFVGAGFSTATSNQVLAYTFANGAWQLPVASTVANLRNFALTLDRAGLLSLTDTQVIDLSPATFVQRATPTTLTPGPDPFLRGIVATNDGQAFIVSSSPGGPSQHFLYDVAARTSPGPTASYLAPEIAGPDNGTRAVIFQGGGPQTVQQYSAFTGLVSATPLVLNHFHPVTGRIENINLPAFDRDGNRMLVAGLTGGIVFHAVFDANFAELGRVPSTDLVAGNTVNTAAYAVSPDGTRAFILQIGATGGVCRVRAFDLTVPPGPGVLYPEVTVIGFPIDLSPISNCPSSAFDQATRILVNPNGDTLLIAGNQLIRIVRLP
ncbi:MAG TPA: IPT/TIG domain-containing protein [Burkholderiales bacterium]